MLGGTLGENAAWCSGHGSSTQEDGCGLSPAAGPARHVVLCGHRSVFSSPPGRQMFAAPNYFRGRLTNAPPETGVRHSDECVFSCLDRLRLHTLLVCVLTFDRRRPRNSPLRQAPVISLDCVSSYACLHVLIALVSLPCSPASSTLAGPRLHLRSPASTRTPPRDGSGEGVSPQPSTAEPEDAPPKSLRPSHQRPPETGVPR